MKINKYKWMDDRESLEEWLSSLPIDVELSNQMHVKVKDTILLLHIGDVLKYDSESQELSVYCPRSINKKNK